MNKAFKLFMLISVLFLITPAFAANWNSSFNANLVAYWNLNETSGTNVQDVFNSYNLTNNGGAAVNQSGKIGTSYLFTRSETDLLTSSNAAFDDLHAGSFSVSLWIKFVTTNAAQYVITKRVSTTTGWAFHISPDAGTNYMAVEYSTPLRDEAAFNTTGINFTDWNHYVFTFDASDGKGRFYINGLLRRTTSGAASGTVTSDSGGALRIGNDVAGSNKLGAYLDEIAIFEGVALTEAQATNLYASSSGMTYSSGSTNSAPTITLNSPATGSTNHNSSVRLDWTVYDSDLDLINVTLYNSTGSALLTNNSVANNSRMSYTWTGLAASTTYNYNITAIDNTSQKVSTLYSFTTMGTVTNPTVSYPINKLINITTFNLTWSQSTNNNNYIWELYNASQSLLNRTSRGATQNWTQSTLAEGHYYWKIFANNSFGISSDPGYLSFKVDTHAPTITWTFPINGITYANYNWTNFSILIADTNLYSYNISLTNATGSRLFFESGTNWTTSSKQITNYTAISGVGLYNLGVCGADDHTALKLNASTVIKATNIKTKSMTLAVEKKNNVSIQLVSDQNIDSMKITEYDDRLSPEISISSDSLKTTKDDYDENLWEKIVELFSFNPDGDNLYEFILKTEEPLIYRPNSDYSAHFVSGNTWIDFETDDSKARYKIEKIDKTSYRVYVISKSGELKFQSIGGVNINCESVTFTIYEAPIVNMSYPENNDVLIEHEQTVQCRAYDANIIRAELYVNDILVNYTQGSVNTTDVNTSRLTETANISADLPSYSVYASRIADLGQRFYVSGHNTHYGHSICEFTLNTAYSLNNLTFEGCWNSTSLSGNNYIRGFDFKPDGSKVYFVESKTGAHKVWQLTLGTNWDITSVSATTTESLSDVSFIMPTSIRVNSSGTSLWISSVDSGDITLFTLSSAWDLDSTFTKTGTDYSTGRTDVRFDWNEAGDKIYISGLDNGYLESGTTTAWSIATTDTSKGNKRYGLSSTSLDFSNSEEGFFLQGLGKYEFKPFSAGTDLNLTYTTTFDYGYHNYSCIAYQKDWYSNYPIETYEFLIKQPIEINITYPLDSAIYSSHATSINWTSDVGTADTCWYSLDSGNTNTTFNCNQNVTGITSTESSNTWTLWQNDTDSLEGTSRTTFTVDTLLPVINFTFPENGTIYSTLITVLNYSISDANIDSCWYGDLIGNYTINCAAYFYECLVTSEGENTIYIWANDTVGNLNFNMSTFVVDTIDPIINITYPLNHTYYEVVTALNYTFTEVNPDTCWYSTNNSTTNTTIACGTNITGLISYEGNNTWFVWINDSTGKEAGSNITFLVDAVPPVLTLYNPQDGTIEEFVNTLNFNVTLNYSATDLSLDTCWYYSDFNETESIFTCNAPQYIPYVAAGSHWIVYAANDSNGNSTIESTNFTIFNHNYAQTASENATLEGYDVIFTLMVDSTGNPSTTARLYYDGTYYIPTTTTQNSTSYYFSRTLTIPQGSGNTTGANVTWFWKYNISTYVTDYLTSNESIIIYAFGIDNCSEYTTVLVNFTLFDEESNSLMDITNQTSLIETEVGLRINDTLLQYNTSITNSTVLPICVPDYLFNYSNFDLYVTTRYVADSYASEFYTIDGEYITASDLPRQIYLRDLVLADSTSFKFTFYDDNTLTVPNGVIEVIRKYIADGTSRIVERPQMDSNGETIVHLVEEDIIYSFNVYQNEELLYSSTNYNAICQSVPCEIFLYQSKSLTPNPSTLSPIGGTWNISTNTNTRVVTLAFSAAGTQTLNMTIYRINDTADFEPVTSNTITATSGTVDVTIPVSNGNQTFIAYVTNETGGFVGYEVVNLSDIEFGMLGNILVFIFIVVGLLIASQEGKIPVLIFTIVFIITSVSLHLIDMTLQGVAIIIVGILVLLWKLRQNKYGGSL